MNDYICIRWAFAKRLGLFGSFYERENNPMNSSIVAQEQDENTLVDEIMKAHVICIVYSVDDDHTIERVSVLYDLAVRANKSS